MSGYAKQILGCAWRDCSARNWFIRTIGLMVLAFVIGSAIWSFWGPRMLAHPQIGSLVAGIVAAVVVALGSLSISILKAPGKLLRERDEALQTAQVKLSATEAIRQQHANAIEALRRDHANAIEALRREHESAVLTVTAFTDPLSQTGDVTDDRVESLYLGRRFAVLKVTNEGHKNLLGVVAIFQFAEGSDECVWSLETGETFVPGGRNSADLRVGETRLLVVAQAFGEDGLWTRWPTGGPIHVLPLRVEQEHAVTFVNRSGRRVLNLGADVAVAVRMKGMGIDQTMRFRLWFNQGEPAIDAAPAPPPADHPSPTASR